MESIQATTKRNNNKNDRETTFVSKWRMCHFDFCSKTSFGWRIEEIWNGECMWYRITIDILQDFTAKIFVNAIVYAFINGMIKIKNFLLKYYLFIEVWDIYEYT